MELVSEVERLLTILPTADAAGKAWADMGEVLDAGEGAVLVLARKEPTDLSAVLPHATHTVHRVMTHKHEDIEELVAELKQAHDQTEDPAVQG